MESLLIMIAVLACPVGMGAMMWMMRGQGSKAQDSNAGSGEQQKQVEQLRAEVDQLKAERAARRTEGTH